MNAYVALPLLIALFAAYVWARREIARMRQKRAFDERRRRIRKSIDDGTLAWNATSARSTMRAGDDPELLTRGGHRRRRTNG
jgi:hypothetical protein